MVKCSIEGKEVGCDGICKAVRDKTYICPVLEKALDVALNGRKMVMHVLLSLKEEV